MYYLYRINSQYDGFTPTRIPLRIQGGYMTYNWSQYFDEASRGDIVFTYFVGIDKPKGLYLISKIVKKLEGNQVKAKVLNYDRKKPVLPPAEFDKISKLIFNRPRGSVFTIPTFLDRIFDKLLQERISSDIEVSENIDCYSCFDKKEFPCDKCSIFDRDYLINWQKEVQLTISGYEGIVSPFWIIPYQSHWTKTSIRKHVLSRIFYNFKAGYTLYGTLFARAIKKAIGNDPSMKGIKYDYMMGVPLSPKKRKQGEADRVRIICETLSRLMKIKYLPDALSLAGHISRREYRYDHTTTEFIRNYTEKLELNVVRSIENKNTLIIDDVITDGKTLQTIAEKIKRQYPNSHLFAATCGIFLKKPNASHFAVEKFER